MPSLFLTSRLIPFAHGFSVRQGGVSEGPYASLNLGFTVGDAPERVEENLRRLCRESNVEEGRLVTVSQVHGDRVLEAAGTEATGLQPPIGEADALWTGVPGVAVGVRTADCVPVLLADPESGQVAAVHSGWRGTEAEIARRAVETLVAQGAKAERLVAAVGPCIRSCCYEVSDDLGAAFERRFGPEVVLRRDGKPFLDLPQAVRQTLLRAGVAEEGVEDLRRCNHCEPTHFFSHRRDRGLSGRHLSFIVAKAPATAAGPA